MYMKQPPAERRQYAPVKIIGKQPNSDVWVFNADVHMDGSGNVIPLQQRKFMLEGEKNDHVVNVPTDLDSGEFKALKNLFKAEKALFGNNFPQVLMAHAASSLCANFDLTIDLFDGCAIPVLIGHPVSGKSTALKAVLSVFGNYQLVHNVTRKYIESQQSSSTVPFGWDDVADAKMLGEIAVSSFNQAGSATMRGQYRPHTVPIVTTNLDSSQLKIKSRWFCIQFEELCPKLTGADRYKKEADLKSVMKKSSKSVAAVTSFMYSSIEGITADKLCDSMNDIIEEACFSDQNLKDIDHCAKQQFALMLFCCNKLLKAVELEEEFDGVVEKMKKVVLPSYAQATPPKLTQAPFHGKDQHRIEHLLKDVMPKMLLNGNRDDVLSFFDQDFLPQRCDCGEAVTFHVNSLLQHLKNSNSTQGITEYSLRYFIKDHGIGCVGRQVHFRNRAAQVSAAHIRREWFHAEDMDALDKWLGKRHKKGCGKSQGVKKTGKGSGTEDTGNDPQGMAVVGLNQDAEFDQDLDASGKLGNGDNANDLQAPVTTEKCYLCSKEVAYGHKCFTCREVICTFPSCSTAHEEDDLASPVYFCKNCKKDEKPSCSAQKRLQDAWNDGQGLSGKRTRLQKKK